MKFATCFLFIIVILSAGCRKDSKVCLQAFDPAGFDALGLVICDKTIAEAEAAYPQFWFYDVKEPKYCWRIQSPTYTSYARDITQSMAERTTKQFGLQFSRVDCNTFCKLTWEEKHKSKITNQSGPVRIIPVTLVSADSCSKLNVGRVEVVRETADSLITRELVKKNS